MDKNEYETLKAKFLKLLATVPIPLRDEIIGIVDEKPVSWNVAYGEIKQDTENAENLLQHFKNIELI